jgi:cell division protein FtsW (lipid II flippase)
VSSRAVTWRRVDFSLIAVSVILAGFGLVVVYSATRGSGPVPIRSFVDRQMTFAFIGVASLAVGAVFDYRRLRGLIVPVYVGTMFVLLAVPLLGVKVNGHRAWFRVGPFQLQPSEFAKIVVIVAVASFFTINRTPPALREVFIGLVIVGVPAAIIMLEPDLGTVLVYVAFTAAVLVVAGVRPRALLRCSSAWRGWLR